MVFVTKSGNRLLNTKSLRDQWLWCRRLDSQSDLKYGVLTNDQ